ncbi:acyl-CoA N-acyltransferase [Microdochium bolleyi]|uniref:Acyl-CoA N-acyltransferase n=1 Tax=Microdochium bolleyi TaxID=196109 RepID=A0A136IWP5_9PEZI|nr:acyl-CoA N-acyltransferase [Microdochium bolleyi]
MCELPERVATERGDPPGTAWPGWAYLPTGPFASEAELTRQIREYSQTSDPLFYAVVTKRDIATTTTATTPAGSAVGWISFLSIATAHQSIEIGHVGFSPVLQRTVAATETFYLMIRHAFEDLGNRRVEWKCDSLNGPSRRAAERLGFQSEGVFRKHRIVRGRNRDTAWFSIMDEEWYGGGNGEGVVGLKAGFEAWLKEENFDENGLQKKTLEQVQTDVAGGGSG